VTLIEDGGVCGWCLTNGLTLLVCIADIPLLHGADMHITSAIKNMRCFSLIWAVALLCCLPIDAGRACDLQAWQPL
jgi:hypothetical protein